MSYSLRKQRKYYFSSLCSSWDDVYVRSRFILNFDHCFCVHFFEWKNENIIELYIEKILHLNMRGFRGGGGGGSPDPTPWDLSEVGSFVDVWWVGAGVQRLFLTYFILLLYFFLFYIKMYKCLKNPNHFQVQRVIPSERHTFSSFFFYLLVNFFLSESCPPPPWRKFLEPRLS